MQRFVSEKAGISDIRGAILVDFVYMITLFYFKNLSTLPMSTTWVFMGYWEVENSVLVLQKGASKNVV